MNLKFPKEPRFLDRKYLDHLRTQSDIFEEGRYSNDSEAVDPAHYKIGGTSMKGHDFLATPLMHFNHVEQGDVGWDRYIADRMTPNHATFMRSWQCARVVDYLTWKLQVRNDYELVNMITEKNNVR